MYKRLLVPVDGGTLTERAIQASLELATQLGASIVGFVVAPLPPASQRAGALNAPDEADDEITTTAGAHQALAFFKRRAQEAKVPYEGF